MAADMTDIATTDIATQARIDVVYGDTIRRIATCAKVNDQGAALACHAWLEARSEGMPMVALMIETARNDARFWSSTASPVELECYLVAAVDALSSGSGGIHSRQMKRLVAALWQRMTEEERKGFILWVKQQHEAGK